MTGEPVRCCAVLFSPMATAGSSGPEPWAYRRRFRLSAIDIPIRLGLSARQLILGNCASAAIEFGMAEARPRLTFRSPAPLPAPADNRAGADRFLISQDGQSLPNSFAHVNNKNAFSNVFMKETASMSLLKRMGGAKSALDIAADLQPKKPRPAEKIKEGLNEVLAVAKGEAEPYKIHKPKAKKAIAKPAEPAPVEAKRRGRPSSGKTAIKIRIDNDVIEAFKAKGDGWQTAINSELRKALGI